MIMSRPYLLLAAVLAAGLACGEPQPPDVGEAFVEMHAAHAREVDIRDLKERIISTLFADDPNPRGWSVEVLRGEIIERLNIGFLIDQLDDGYLARTEMSLEPGAVTDGVAAYALTIHDPMLPVPIEARVLAPAAQRLSLDASFGLRFEDGTMARPAIVGLHGHGQTPELFQSQGYGQELAEQGYVVVIPSFWFMECGVEESALSELLLHRGFALMGLRVYKALVMLRVLRSSEAIDPARLGMIAHSGGSSASWLVVRISDEVRARVWDYQQFFNNLCGERIHCETDPDLFVIGGDIFRSTTLGSANLAVPYAYFDPAIRDDIRAFFAAELAP